MGHEGVPFAGSVQEAMYEDYWGLTEPPFRPAPDPRFLYPCRQHQQALGEVLASLDVPGGGAIILGATGTGKSALLGKLAGSLDPVRRPTLLLSGADVTPAGLYRAVLEHLGAPSRARTREELKTALWDLSQKLAAREQHPVVLVDDAHLTKDKAVFDELQTLLDGEGTPPVFSVVLAGRADLLKKLEKADGLRQRLST